MWLFFKRNIHLNSLGIALLVTVLGCTKQDIAPLPIEEYPVYHTFHSYKDFINSIDQLANIEDSLTRVSNLNTFWDSLVNNNQVPFIMNDSVAFLYKKESDDVVWAGDFNGWGSVTWSGTRLGFSDITVYQAVFPSDARLDYKIIDNGRWRLDPVNEYTQEGGFGPNSELRMPDWEYPVETINRDDITPGILSDNLITYSSNLGYNVQYKIYTPYNYESVADLPVIYLTDGQDYANDAFGSMVTVLDNLIFDEVINPIIAVFIDPRNPDNLAENRRAEEYRSNLNFANFVGDELAAKIDNQYKTSPSADDRAILGASYGGWNSSYFGLVRSDKFGLIGIHSPSTSNDIIQG